MLKRAMYSLACSVDLSRVMPPFSTSTRKRLCFKKSMWVCPIFEFKLQRLMMLVKDRGVLQKVRISQKIS